MAPMRRTGSEPLQARSPLRLRLGLALCGLIWGAAATVGFAMAEQPGWAALVAAIGIMAGIDVFVVVRRMRQGAHYQPGPDVPPYLPDEPDRPVRPNHRVTPNRRGPP